MDRPGHRRSRRHRPAPWSRRLGGHRQLRRGPAVSPPAALPRMGSELRPRRPPASTRQTTRRQGHSQRSAELTRSTLADNNTRRGSRRLTGQPEELARSMRKSLARSVRNLEKTQVSGLSLANCDENLQCGHHANVGEGQRNLEELGSCADNSGPGTSQSRQSSRTPSRRPRCATTSTGCRSSTATTGAALSCSATPRPHPGNVPGSDPAAAIRTATAQPDRRNDPQHCGRAHTRPPRAAHHRTVRQVVPAR